MPNLWAPAIIRGSTLPITNPEPPPIGRRLAHLGLLGALVAAAGFATWQVAVEWRVSAAESAIAEDRPVPAAAADGSARERMYHGRMLARRAASSTGAERQALLDRADRAIASALAARPRWGEAWVAKAHVAMLRDGVSSPGARDALARSYRETPFLRTAADWRLAYAADQWALLDPATRAAAVREGIVLSRISATQAAHVRVMTAGTPIYPLIAARDMSVSPR